MAPQHHQQQPREGAHTPHHPSRLNPVAALARAATLGGSRVLRHTLLQPSPAPVLQDAQPQQQQDRWRSRHLGWHTAALGTVGFVAVSADVFGPSSAHLLQGIDALGHAVAQLIDPEVRRWLFGTTFSNAFIVAGMLSWTAVTLHVAFNPKPEAASPAAMLGLSWLFYGLMAGRVDGDAWLVGLLKDLFHRARPSPIHRSLSYPSGHTTSATFVVASLLFVFIPVLIHYKLTPPTSSKLYGWLKELEASWPLWGTSWALTAIGRVCVDAHWASDTIAAGFLSLALTSGLALMTEGLLARMDDGEGTAVKVTAVVKVEDSEQ